MSDLQLAVREPGEVRLITDEYRDLNRQLHEQRPDYGTNSRKWAEQVKEITAALSAVSILDYGCGKQSLGEALPHLLIEGYDPALEGLDEAPEEADLVVCTDVLEHVEPDYLEAVLDNLQSLAVKGIFLAVATRPAKKFLADGRNAHLIQESPDWWLPKIMERWEMRIFQALDGEFAVFALRKQP